MTNLRDIKLVVWDLDDTFWRGTLTEGEVVIPEEHLQLVKRLTDCGIINSICSKNDMAPVERRLREAGIWDYFVFPSVNWEGKGPRLQALLERMALRPANTLFLDDNPANLGEARHFMPAILTDGPEAIPELIAQAAQLETKDPGHQRLAQYKTLEKKDREAASFGSVEEFLYSSHIRVGMHHDCLAHLPRLHDLLMRSNQLNYTKKRISIEELQRLLDDPDYDCGYVTVQDRFGDYGIVGFYALHGQRLEHFIFSCRTMGQQVEQWVFAQLGFPELEVVGKVRNQLDNTTVPGWINQPESSLETPAEAADTATSHCRVLLKGPCDLSHSQMYIKNNSAFDTEFTYVSNADGQVIDAHNHSVHIWGLHEYTDAEKEEIVRDCPFVDPKMLSGNFFTKDYDIIFLSTLIESTYCIYRKKGTRIRVVFGGNDLTDPTHWKGYCDGSYYTGGNKFTEQWLKAFAEKYECEGQTTPESYTAFLQDCDQWLPAHTHLCLILGATRGYEGDEKSCRKHLALNNAVKDFAQEHPRIQYIEIDNCIHGADDFTDGINHFSTRVYYEIAQAMARAIAQVTGTQVNTYSSRMVFFDRWVLSARKILKGMASPDSRAYQGMKQIYDKIYKHRK